MPSNEPTDEAFANETIFLTTGLETVLISTSQQPTGRERIVLAFRDGDELFIPLDSGRHANQELFDAPTLFVRETDNQDECGVYAVQERRPISTVNRARLNNYAHRNISETTEVLHLTGAQLSIAMLRREPPGFVVVVDGSERAVSAISPAIVLADWYGRPCTVIAATAGSDDRDTRLAVMCQLEATRLSLDDVIQVAKLDLEGALFDMMRQGHIVVAPAFGVWAVDGRLHGMLNGLVRHNAPAIVGIGPNVGSDWKPMLEHPIIVCVDDSAHAHHVVDKLEPFLRPSRARVIVAHIASPSQAVSPVAQQVANEIHELYGVPVEAQTITDASPAAAIAILAARTESQLVVTHSWHRPQAGSPAVCSISLTAIAHAPCPVAVLGE